MLSDLTLLIALASGEIAQGRGELRRRRLEDDRLCQPHLAFALILSGKDLKTPCGSHKHLQRQAKRVPGWLIPSIFSKGEIGWNIVKQGSNAYNTQLYNVLISILGPFRLPPSCHSGRSEEACRRQYRGVQAKLRRSKRGQGSPHRLQDQGQEFIRAQVLQNRLALSIPAAHIRSLLGRSTFIFPICKFLSAQMYQFSRSLRNFRP